MSDLASQIEALSAAATPGHWDTMEGLHLAQEYADKTRAELTKGELSDLHLANRMYLAGREDLDLIVWQTAAKERIRWLSVQLALALNAQAEVEALRARVAELEKAATAIRDDLLDRAKWDDDTKVVVAGNGVWHRFCKALEEQQP